MTVIRILVAAMIIVAASLAQAEETTFELGSNGQIREVPVPTTWEQVTVDVSEEARLFTDAVKEAIATGEPAVISQTTTIKGVRFNLVTTTFTKLVVYDKATKTVTMDTSTTESGMFNPFFAWAAAAIILMAISNILCRKTCINASTAFAAFSGVAAFAAFAAGTPTFAASTAFVAFVAGIAGGIYEKEYHIATAVFYTAIATSMALMYFGI